MKGHAGSEASRKPIDRQILEIFRDNNGALSGAQLARTLGITRTAVWKHVEGLRSQGYSIESRRSVGYTLLESPDVLTPAAVTAALESSRLARRVICLSETGSTNGEAAVLAEAGAEEGTLVLAESQSRGKGRLGRAWHSPGGVNLYISLILRPHILPIAASQLTFLSSIAVAESIESLTCLAPLIKWPNDILINGKKVAGLLNEMSAETERVNHVILGIGINVNMKPDQFPDDLRHPATSLFIEGRAEVSRLELLRRLILSLDSHYARYLEQGFPAIRQEWISRCGMIGKSVAVSGGSEHFEGVASGIDESGALLVDRADGSSARVLSGDVSIL